MGTLGDFDTDFFMAADLDTDIFMNSSSSNVCLWARLGPQWLRLTYIGHVFMHEHEQPNPTYENSHYVNDDADHCTYIFTDTNCGTGHNLFISTTKGLQHKTRMHCLSYMRTKAHVEQTVGT